MSEQVIITRLNEGIEIEVQFLDNKKKPVDITGCTIEVGILNPNLQLEMVQANIKDYTNGIALLVLERKDTTINGLWSTYWSAIKENGYVTSQEAVYYFVVPRFGGNDNEENS